MVAHLAFSGEDVRAEGQATFEMANLAPEDTGLRFVVFVSQKDDASHASRVKVSQNATVVASEMGSYGITPFQHRAGPQLDTRDERMLRQWVDLNRDVLQGYWDGTIMYTRELFAKLKPL